VRASSAATLLKGSDTYITLSTTIGVVWKVAVTPLCHDQAGASRATFVVSMAESEAYRCPPRSWPCSVQPSTDWARRWVGRMPTRVSEAARRRSDVMYGPEDGTES
jgi:hypothetical protein